MVSVSEVLIESGNKFCQYCKLPSQEKFHEECQAAIQQWQKECQAVLQRWQDANFDMGKFWDVFLGNERDAFLRTHNALYSGFLPYDRYYHLFKFTIVDQHKHTIAFVHAKYCSRYALDCDWDIGHNAKFGCVGKMIVSSNVPDIKGFWSVFLGEERDDFVANHQDLYNGFLPYGRTGLIGFYLTDQHDFANSFLHRKYCRENHDCSFGCFLEWGS